MSGPCQHGTAQDNQKHAEDDATIHFLLKYHPGKYRGEYGFQVQEQ